MRVFKNDDGQYVTEIRLDSDEVEKLQAILDS